jgi:hypothetical protein
VNGIFQKHEPANIKKEYFTIIKIEKDTKKWQFKDFPNCVNSLNRYLIEKEDICEFINYLTTTYDIYSFVYFATKSNHLTKVQKIIKQRNFQKNGWEKSDEIDDLYVYKISCFNEVQASLIDDYDVDTIFVFLEKGRNINNINKILKEFSYFSQPKDIGSFYLTKDSISALLDYKIGSINMQGDFYERNANEERSIFICYVPWKL